jgi:hypothetical protein
LTAALLLLPVSFSAPHAERSADCSADYSADHFVDYSAETFVSAFVVLGAWIVVVLRTKVSLAVAAAVVTEWGYDSARFADLKDLQNAHSGLRDLLLEVEKQANFAEKRPLLNRESYWAQLEEWHC